MSTQPSNLSPRFLFGPFEYDPASGELRKHRSRIRLQGQPVQILSVLLECPGDAVSREELQRRLWPGAVSGDFEHGLNAAVNKLRQALGDSADQPRYIETLPARGYRFIAPVQTPLRPVLEIARSTPVWPEQARPRAAMRWLPVFAGLLVVVIAAATSYWIDTKRNHPLSGLRPTQFTIAPPPGFFLEGAGNRQSFAVSPDGSQLAFTAMDDSGLFRVFIRDLQKLEPWVVPDSAAGAHTLFWHPDGKSLLFTAGGKLRRVIPSAESTQVLADSLGLYAGAYLRPDRLLLSSRMTSAVVPSSGGSLERLKDVYAWPQMLPDGETLLHVAFDVKLGRYRGRVSRFGDTKAARDLVETDSKVV